MKYCRISSARSLPELSMYSQLCIASYVTSRTGTAPSCLPSPVCAPWQSRSSPSRSSCSPPTGPGPPANAAFAFAGVEDQQQPVMQAGVPADRRSCGSWGGSESPRRSVRGSSALHACRAAQASSARPWLAGQHGAEIGQSCSAGRDKKAQRFSAGKRE